MKRVLSLIIILSIILASTQALVFADVDIERPEPPRIEWDSDYSNSASSQKVTMYAEIPDGAYK